MITYVIVMIVLGTNSYFVGREEFNTLKECRERLKTEEIKEVSQSLSNETNKIVRRVCMSTDIPAIYKLMGEKV